jgi:hypothetical protein
MGLEQSQKGAMTRAKDWKREQTPFCAPACIWQRLQVHMVLKIKDPPLDVCILHRQPTTRVERSQSRKKPGVWEKGHLQGSNSHMYHGFTASFGHSSIPGLCLAQLHNFLSLGCGSILTGPLLPHWPLHPHPKEQPECSFSSPRLIASLLRLFHGCYCLIPETFSSMLVYLIWLVYSTSS